MSAPTNASSTDMSNTVSSQPSALNANVVLQFLSENLNRLGLEENTRHEILPLDTYTFCGGQRDLFRKVFAPSTIYKSTEGSMQDDATVDGIFDKARERMQSTPVPNPKDSLYEALSVAANGKGKAPSAESLRLNMLGIESMTRNLVLDIGPDSTETFFPFPLPNDLGTEVGIAYLFSLRHDPGTQVLRKHTFIERLAERVLQCVTQYTGGLELDQDTKADIALFDAFTACDWDQRMCQSRLGYLDRAGLSAAFDEAREAIGSLPSLDDCFNHTMEETEDSLLQRLAIGLFRKPPTASFGVEMEPWGERMVPTRHVVIFGVEGLSGHRFPFPLPDEEADSVARASAQRAD